MGSAGASGSRASLIGRRAAHHERAGDLAQERARRSIARPTRSTTSHRAPGVAGWRKSKGSTAASAKPAARRARAARKREKAISSGETPKYRLVRPQVEHDGHLRVQDVGLGEDAPAARPQDPEDLGERAVEIEVVQDGAAVDGVEGRRRRTAGAPRCRGGGRRSGPRRDGPGPSPAGPPTGRAPRAGPRTAPPSPGRCRCRSPAPGRAVRGTGRPAPRRSRARRSARRRPEGLSQFQMTSARSAISRWCSISRCRPRLAHRPAG